MEFTQILFQSTLRRTERLSYLMTLGRMMYFNPRSDERSDPYILSIFRYIVIFQSTLRRTERRLVAKSKAQQNLDFNPRSDERSDHVDDVYNYCVLISIHAPTNGATAILHKKMKKTIQNRLIILLFSTNSLRLLCSCTQYSFFLFIFHGANDLVILCSLSFRTTSKN